MGEYRYFSLHLENQSAFMMNFSEKLTIKIIISTRLAVFMRYVYMMMREERLSKDHKLLYRQDYSSIWLIRKMMRKI